MEKVIRTYAVKVHSTKDKRKLKNGEKKEYEYGTINIRDIQLKGFIGKFVKVYVAANIRQNKSSIGKKNKRLSM